MDDLRFEFLAALAPDHAVSAEQYQQLTRGMAHEAKAELVQWLGEVGIDVRPSASMREALYHSAPGRQYKPTRLELDTGKFSCPSCKVVLVRVTRKAKDCIFRCPGCSWAIAKSDIFDPAMGAEPQLDPTYPEGIAPAQEDAEGPW
jgi:ribosomal protein L37AE/L43A